MIDSANGKPRLPARVGRHGSNQFQPGCITSRLGGSWPHRTRREVVHIGVAISLKRFLDGMRRSTNQQLGPDDCARLCRRQIVLTHMHDVDTGNRCDVGSIVHTTEFVMAKGSVAQDLDERDGLLGLHRLVTKLHDVDAFGKEPVDEGAEGVDAAVRVSAAIEPRLSQQSNAL